MYLQTFPMSLAPSFASSFALALVQFLIHGLELLTLGQGHFRDRASILERRDYADGLVTLVGLEGLLEGGPHRSLPLFQRVALGLGRREILSFRDCLPIADPGAASRHHDPG